MTGKFKRINFSKVDNNSMNREKYKSRLVHWYLINISSIYIFRKISSPVFYILDEIYCICFTPSFPFHYLSVCPSVYVSVCLFWFLFLYHAVSTLFLALTFTPSLSVCLSVSLSRFPSLMLYIYSFPRSHFHSLSICLCVCVCMSVCLVFSPSFMLYL